MMQPKPATHALFALGPLLFAVIPVRASGFDSIFSIHTERTPYCPPNYNPDPKYVGCCWGDYQTITSAKGPNGVLSPGCCWAAETCTGAPPIMYDWTTNGLGQMVVVTPGASASQQDVPTNSGPSLTAEHSNQAPVQTSTPTVGSTSQTSSATEGRPTSGGGLSTGAIVGIVVSIFCSVASLIFGIWFRFYKLRRKERMQAAQAERQQHQPKSESYPASPVSPRTYQWAHPGAGTRQNFV